MHRSGTSLLAGSLQQAGLYLGRVNTWVRFNQKGNRELSPVFQFHEDLFSRHGFAWYRPPGEDIAWTPRDRALALSIFGAFHGVPVWGFKDPRTIWMIEEYLALFPEAMLIGTFRHSDAVIASLAARDRAVPFDPGEALEHWRSVNRRLLALWRTRPVTLVRFSEDGIDDPLFSSPVHAFREQLGLTGDPMTFYEPSFVHHRPIAPPAKAEDAQLFDELIAAAEKGIGR